MNATQTSFPYVKERLRKIGSRRRNRGINVNKPQHFSGHHTAEPFGDEPY
jgi:hypothetical protein